jgi:uncharacterized protein (TIGR03066 family)
MLLTGVGGGLALLLTFSLMVKAAESKEGDAKKLIVGKWEPSTSKQVSVIVEFKPTGELSISMKCYEKNLNADGKYKFKDEKTIELTIKNPLNGDERMETITIKSISKDEMVLVDSRKKEDTFKRIK